MDELVVTTMMMTMTTNMTMMVLVNLLMTVPLNHHHDDGAGDDIHRQVVANFARDSLASDQRSAAQPSRPTHRDHQTHQTTHSTTINHVRRVLLDRHQHDNWNDNWHAFWIWNCLNASDECDDDARDADFDAVDHEASFESNWRERKEASADRIDPDCNRAANLLWYRKPH
jgi:hypothetical protein